MKPSSGRLTPSHGRADAAAERDALSVKLLEAARPARGAISLIVVIALAAFVRLSTIAQQSFWLDEAATLKVVHRSADALLPAIRDGESTPPLYYVLAWIWSHVFGYSEIAVRSLPALAGIATVAVVYLAAERIGGRRAGWIAGAIAALNPLLVWYSQEGRAYSLLALFGALSFLLALRALDEPRAAGRLWIWAAAAALALCTHYFAILFVAPEALWLMLRTRREARWPIVALGVATVPLLALAASQRSSGRTDWISGSPLDTRLALLPKQFLTGLGSPAQTSLALIALIAVTVLAVVLARRCRELPEALLVGAAIAVGAPLVMAVLAVAGLDIVLTRNAVGVLPIACVVLGVGLAVMSRAGAALALPIGAAIAGAGAFALAGVVADDTYQRPNWRDAAATITTTRAEHVVVLLPRSSRLPLSVYVPLRARAASDVVQTAQIDVVRFLLDIQGRRRGRTGVELPQGFGAGPARRWPGLEVVRYTASSPRSVRLADLEASAYVVPAR